MCVCGRWRECIRPRVDLQMFVQANREPPVVPHLVWNEYLRRMFRFDFGERYNGDAAFACVAVKLKKKNQHPKVAPCFGLFRFMSSVSHILGIL